MPLRLVVRYIFQHKLRASLTLASLAIAIFLLCVLRSLVVSLDAGVRAATSDRLVVQSAVSLFVILPESYKAKLQAVEGVDEVARVQWFGGYYQDRSNFFGQFAIDKDEFLYSFPEIQVTDGSLDQFFSERQACLVGRQTAEKYGFEVGQSVPIIGEIFQRIDGDPWSFTVAGIYELSSLAWDETTIFFSHDYLDESLEAGLATGPRGTGIFYLKLDGSVDPVTVAASVDALFENGPQRVQTTSESEFNAQFVSMVGNVPLFVSTIGGGVLAAIVLAVLNTMLLAGREQTRDVGVLKALGFTDSSVFGVMLTQGILVTGLGGAAGIAMALGTEGAMATFLGNRFPGYAITDQIVTQAAGLSLGIGLLAGLFPAMRARRMMAIDALRRLG